MTSPGAFLPRLRTRARRLIDRPKEEWSPLPRAGILTLHVLVSCARKLGRDRAPQMAAALAFETLFSLLPLLVLVILVLHSVRGLEGTGAQLRTMVVELLVPESLVGHGSRSGRAARSRRSGHRAGVQRRARGAAPAHRRRHRGAVGGELRRPRRRRLPALRLRRDLPDAHGGEQLQSPLSGRRPAAVVAPRALLHAAHAGAVRAGRGADPAGSPARESRHLHGRLVGGAVRLRRAAAGVLRGPGARVPHASPTPGWRGARR